MKAADWFILFVLCQFLVSGCVTRQKCADRFPCPGSTASTDSSSVRDSLITPLHTSAGTSINCDSLAAALKKLPAGTSLKSEDSTGQAQLSFTIDSLGNLLVKCQSRPDPIPVRKIEYRYRTKEIVKYIDRPIEKVTTVYRTPWWSWFTIGVMGILLIQAYARNLLKRLPL